MTVMSVVQIGAPYNAIGLIRLSNKVVRARNDTNFLFIVLLRLYSDLSAFFLCSLLARINFPLLFMEQGTVSVVELSK